MIEKPPEPPGEQARRQQFHTERFPAVLAAEQRATHRALDNYMEGLSQIALVAMNDAKNAPTYSLRDAAMCIWGIVSWAHRQLEIGKARPMLEAYGEASLDILLRSYGPNPVETAEDPPAFEEMLLWIEETLERVRGQDDGDPA